MKKLMMIIVGAVSAMCAFAAELPAGYTAVEYIESTKGGCQFIDTGYTANAQTKVEFDAVVPARWEQNDRFGVLFGSRTMTDWWVKAFALQMCDGNTAVDTVRFAYNGWYRQDGVKPFSFGERVTVTCDGQHVEWTGSKAASVDFTAESLASSKSTLYIFADNTVADDGAKSKTGLNHSVMRLYSFVITEGGTLKRDFVPCVRLADAIAGLYDTVEGKFYGNSGSGNFAMSASSLPFARELTSGTYEITESFAFAAPKMESALKIAEGATVTLNIAAGVEVTLRGGDAHEVWGGGAGIEVPANATLKVSGAGTLNAYGGKGANGCNGVDGGNGSADGNNGTFTSGAGGWGGGGAGAGIGGHGASGGGGGNGGQSVTAYGWSYTDLDGKSGDNGGNGKNGGTCGTVLVEGTVKVFAAGGAAGADGKGGSFGRGAWLAGSTYDFGAFGGGGGGSGSKGGAAANIGGGGAGGYGGGGGGSGGYFSRSSKSGLISCKANGGGGAGANAGDDGSLVMGGEILYDGFSYPGGAKGTGGAPGGNGTLTVAGFAVVMSPSGESDSYSVGRVSAAEHIRWEGGKLYRVVEGVRTELTYSVVDAATSSLESGWYVVKGAISRGKIDVNGTANLVLLHNSSLTASGAGSEAGVAVSYRGALNIFGVESGSLTATGGKCGAGIGGGDHGAGGIVTINGGTVTAQGGDSGAGIGGGDYGVGGTVTVNGGTVTATGGYYGAGIGGGYGGAGGDVTINGGMVTATGVNHGWHIGGGKDSGAGGTLTLGPRVLKIDDRHYQEGVTADFEIPAGLQLVSVREENGGPAKNTGNGAKFTAAVLSGQRLVLTFAAADFRYRLAGDAEVTFGPLSSDIAIGVSQLPRAVEAARESVDYALPNGETATAENVCPLYSTAATMAMGQGAWYVVMGEVTTAAIEVNGEANLILADGATLTVSGGIGVDEGATLNIYGQESETGELIAIGAENCAGIGGRNPDGLDGCGNCGNVAILGGEITATGGTNAAGIGGGYKGTGGMVTLGERVGVVEGAVGNGSSYVKIVNTDEYPTVTVGALRHMTAAWTCGDGSATNAISGTSFSVPYGTTGVQVIFTLDDGPFALDGEAVVELGTVVEDIVFGDGNDYRVPTPTVAYLDWDPATSNLVEKSCADFVIVKNGLEILEDGKWYVVTEDVSNGKVRAIGTTHMILCDGASLTVNAGADNDDPAVLVRGHRIGVDPGTGIGDEPIVVNNNGDYADENAQLVIHGQIQGTGRLTAIGGLGAGIGGGQAKWVNGVYCGYSLGTVKICGGTVIAQGGLYGAGIGGCKEGSGGDVTVYGGTVIAKGGNGEDIGATGASIRNGGGAGIGGGVHGAGGTLTVYGGTVTTTGGVYNWALSERDQTRFIAGAGIGGGSGGAGGTLTVNGGTVTAVGGTHAAGVGSGGRCLLDDTHEILDLDGGCDGGTVMIHGGTVMATGGIGCRYSSGEHYQGGAGIGGGLMGSGGTVEITGGTVVAIGNDGSAGIGGGCNGAGGTVTICGGTVTATGSDGVGFGHDNYYGAGIGGGGQGADGTVTLDETKVEVVEGAYGNGSSYVKIAEKKPVGPTCEGGTIEWSDAANAWVVTPSAGVTAVTIAGLPEGAKVAVPPTVKQVGGVPDEQIKVYDGETDVTALYLIHGGVLSPVETFDDGRHYLESTAENGPYINTGYRPTMNTRIVADFNSMARSANWAAFFGVRKEDKNESGILLRYFRAEDTFNAWFCNLTNNEVKTAAFAGRRITVELKAGLLTIGAAEGTTAYEIPKNGTAPYAGPIYVFCENEGDSPRDYQAMRLYSFKIYDIVEGVEKLVRDLVPFQTTDGTEIAGLYDRVTEKCFVNQGGGTLTLGHDDDAVVSVTPGVPVVFDTADEAAKKAELRPSDEVAKALGGEADVRAAYCAKFGFDVVLTSSGKWAVMAALKPEAWSNLVESAQAATRQIDVAGIAALELGVPTDVTVTNCVPGFYYTIYGGSTVTNLKALVSEKSRNVLCELGKPVKFSEVVKPSDAAGFFSIGVKETGDVSASAYTQDLALALGLVLADTTNPLCKLTEFNVTGNRVSGRIATICDDEERQPGDLARVVLWGTRELGKPFVRICEVRVEEDGSFSQQVDGQYRFFKVSIEPRELLR